MLFGYGVAKFDLIKENQKRECDQKHTKGGKPGARQIGVDVTKK
jgi:hypothetical protein